MPIFRFVIHSNRSGDPRNADLLSDAHTLGFEKLKLIQCEDIYFIDGQLSAEQCWQLASRLLTDPVTQAAEWVELPGLPIELSMSERLVEVTLRPGVTDLVADEIVRVAPEMGIQGIRRVSTGMRYLVVGVDDAGASLLARRLLANPVIQNWSLGEVEPSFPKISVSSGSVETIRLRELSDADLLAVSRSRRAALDLVEMQAIRAFCDHELRDLTDVEFESIAQTWSEHCGHKTFKGKITLDSGNAKNLVIDSLYKTFIRSATEEIDAPWVLSAFVDNAGIIDLDGNYEVSFKVETHNHPSAIEPFGGANTGVGGVIRDIMGVSHRPIANTDVLCFGDQQTPFDELPAGVLHPRRILSGVVAGVQDYGNKMGIPTVNGAILFDPGYSANPLVFCGTVGIAPKGRHVRDPKIGDRLILLGGRTGRDGLRGATFSSMTMDASTGEVSGSSVQIGNPIVEKGLLDVILPARDLGLYTAITDCGAGGLSSAVGEMASGIGVDVELKDVRLKYPGLAPWEIWLSEAQERMVLSVPPDKVKRIQELCDMYAVELTDIGEFTGSGRLVVRYNNEVVLDLTNAFLHAGIPQRELTAKLEQTSCKPVNTADDFSQVDYSSMLLKLLANPNIASKANVIRVYDHEVQGGTVIKPLTGLCNDGPSDACVIKPASVDSQFAIAIACGINVEYGKREPYGMAMAVVDEAIRNAVAVGADPGRIALLDNFCWGDPLREETLGSLVEACRGCRDAALYFRTPFISGKDSLNNEYLGTDQHRHAIPPTLLISSIGVLEHVNRAVSMDLKAAGNILYLLGNFQPVFGGSHFDLVTRTQSGEAIPKVLSSTPSLYRRLHIAISKDLVRACHDLSEGGLAVAAAEMCIAGRLGLNIAIPEEPTCRALFGEVTGCLLAEVEPGHTQAFEAVFEPETFHKLGFVTSQGSLELKSHGQIVIDLLVADLLTAWNRSLQPVFAL